MCATSKNWQVKEKDSLFEKECNSDNMKIFSPLRTASVLSYETVINMCSIKPLSFG
jgi:hypothetical protein